MRNIAVAWADLVFRVYLCTVFQKHHRDLDVAFMCRPVERSEIILKDERDCQIEERAKSCGGSLSACREAVRWIWRGYSPHIIPRMELGAIFEQHL